MPAQRCVLSGSSCSRGGWLRTSETLFADWTANSAVSVAAATRFAFTLLRL